MSLNRLGRWIYHSITSKDRRPYMDLTLGEISARANEAGNKKEIFKLLGLLDELTYRVSAPTQRDIIKKQITGAIYQCEGEEVSHKATRLDIENTRKKILNRYAKSAEAAALAKREAEEQVKREEEKEQARLVADEKARLAAEALAKKKAATAAKQEKERLAGEEKARQQEGAEAKRSAEERAHKEAEAEKARLEAEAKAKREAEEQARREDEQEEARIANEEKVRQREEAEAERSAEERARKEAEAEKPRVEAEAQAKRVAEQEQARVADEDNARVAAEALAKKRAATAGKREREQLAAEEQALRQAAVEVKRMMKANGAIEIETEEIKVSKARKKQTADKVAKQKSEEQDTSEVGRDRKENGKEKDDGGGRDMEKAREETEMKNEPRGINDPKEFEKANQAREVDNQTQKIELSELWLSRKTDNSLRRAGIHTVTDLEKLNVGQLYELKNCGQKTVEEVVGRLNDIGILSEKLSHALESNMLYEMHSVRDELKDTKLIKENRALLPMERAQKEAGEQTRQREEIIRNIFSVLNSIVTNEDTQASIRRLTKAQLIMSNVNAEIDQRVLMAIEKEACSPSPIAILAEVISGNEDLDITHIPISASRLETEELIIAILVQTDIVAAESGLKRIYRQCITNSFSALDEKELSNKMSEENEMITQVISEEFCEGSLEDLRDRAKKIEADSSFRDMIELIRKRLSGSTMSEMGQMRGVSRERIRQLEKRFVEKYRLSKVDIMTKQLKERAREALMKSRLHEIDNEGPAMAKDGDLKVLSRRIEVYRYFNCPVPIGEYIKHLVVWQDVRERSRIGNCYWDNPHNLYGLLWAISITTNRNGLMPKQTTLPRGISAAVQRHGDQSAVAEMTGLQYQGQIRGKDGRTYWTEEKICEYIKEVQKSYCLPAFLMPERQQVKDFIDINGMAAEKGNSCISAMTKQLTLTWEEAAQARGLKIYEECTEEDMLNYRIVWRVLQISNQESDCYYRLQGIWKGEEKITKTESLIEAYRHVVRIGCLEDVEEVDFLGIIKRTNNSTQLEIIDDIANMLF